MNFELVKKSKKNILFLQTGTLFRPAMLRGACAQRTPRRTSHGVWPARRYRHIVFRRDSVRSVFFPALCCCATAVYRGTVEAPTTAHQSESCSFSRWLYLHCYERKDLVGSSKSPRIVAVLVYLRQVMAKTVLFSPNCRMD